MTDRQQRPAVRVTRTRYFGRELQGTLLTREQVREIASHSSPRGQIRALMTYAASYSIKSPDRMHTVSRELARKREQTLIRYTDKLAQLRQRFTGLQRMSTNSIVLVAQAWMRDGLADRTILSRISHLNWVLRCFGHDDFVNATALIAAFRSRPPAAVRTSSSHVIPATLERVEAALDKAAAIDRRAGLALKLIYYLEASPRHVLALRPRSMLEAGAVVLSRGSRYNPTRVVVLTPTGSQLMEQALALPGPRGHDSIRLPGQEAKAARERLKYVARLVGLTTKGIGVTPAQLGKVRKRLGVEHPVPSSNEPEGDGGD
jgi:hypothetical protein